MFLGGFIFAASVPLIITLGLVVKKLHQKHKKQLPEGDSAGEGEGVGRGGLSTQTEEQMQPRFPVRAVVLALLLLFFCFLGAATMSPIWYS